MPWVSFLRYLDRAERRFVDWYVIAGNPGAILRDGLHEYFFMARRNAGMDLLTRAVAQGSVEASYVYSMLLLCNHHGGDNVRRAVDMFEVILTSGNVHMCREIFTDILAESWVGVTPPDPGQPVTCRSSMCSTRGIVGDSHDVSGVSCVRCLADLEVYEFLGMFR
ncbi:uncharacterized protein LOC107458766 [Arachis duranensis]|uniref:At2g35280-like TPR domain-containing protein n=2 Tax=Arachis TaxID=3817 RepID=A0A445CEI2_ARAHY|nr:uncharacterized protein LOC107458766 [Arachis duranensis]RYR49319.1 hypothetical protein Ahy_A07g035770 [Arachis hypogaea]